MEAVFGAVECLPCLRDFDFRAAACRLASGLLDGASRSSGISVSEPPASCCCCRATAVQAAAAAARGCNRFVGAAAGLVVALSLACPGETSASVDSGALISTISTTASGVDSSLPTQIGSHGLPRQKTMWPTCSPRAGFAVGFIIRPRDLSCGIFAGCGDRPRFR